MTDDDTRYGAYTPPPDECDTFDIRTDEQDRRGWWFLGASVMVSLAFVVVVYNTFQLGVRERGRSPIITADAHPYRVVPEDPGGYEAPDQDLSAYQLREGADVQDEMLIPARDVREEPVTPEPVESLPVPQPQETAGADEPDSLVNDPEPVQPKSEAQPASRPPQPEHSGPVQLQPPVQSELSGRLPVEAHGVYVAQIGAFRSRKDAEAGWEAFVTRFPDMAAGRVSDIQPADLGDRGMFHRLRAGAFVSHQEALAFCTALESQGQDCLVVSR